MFLNFNKTQKNTFYIYSLLSVLKKLIISQWLIQNTFTFVMWRSY